MKDNRRRKKIIDIRTQTLIAVEIMLHALLLPVLIIILVALDPFSTLFSDLSAQTHFVTAMDLLEINSGKWPLLILLLIFIGFMSVIFSHHIAGPSLKFKKVFSEISKKDFSQKVVLRKFDYLKEMGEEFNTMMDILKKDMISIKESNDEISKMAEECSTMDQSLKNKTDKIADQSKNIDKTLGSYKLS